MPDKELTEIDEILKSIPSADKKTSSDPLVSELEFEVGENVEKASVSGENTAEVSPKTTPVEPEPKSESGEFVIPESYFEDDKPSDPNVFNVRAVYVPRFTDATEKKHSRTFVREERENLIKPDRGDGAPRDPRFDPTAEIDGDGVRDAIVLKVGGPERISDESTTMFKFESDEPEAKEEAAPPVESVADEPVSSELSEEQTAPNEQISEPTQTEPRPAPRREPPSKHEVISNVGDGKPSPETARGDFNSQKDRDKYKDKFLDSLLSAKVRIAVAVILSLVLLVFENAYLFGFNVSALLGMPADIASDAIIDLQFIIGLSLLALPEILYAIRSLFSKKLVSECNLIVSLIVSLAYLALMIFLNPETYQLFGLVYAILVIVSIVSSHLRKSADFESFKIISQKGVKQVVDNKYTRTLPKENITLDGVIDEYKSKTARVFPASFISDFFKKTKEVSERSSVFAARFLISLISALIAFFLVFFLRGGVALAASAFVLVFFVSMPVASLLVNKLPFSHAIREAAAENGTVIGEKSLFDYSGIDVMTFDDNEAFGAEYVNIQRIMLYGNNENLAKALRQMSALFVNVGGPLDVIFSESLDKRCVPAEEVSVSENGICGKLGDKLVMAGTYEYMAERGALIPENEDAVKKNLDSTRIMYAAENGVVYAKFYIRYRFSEEFTMLLPTMIEEGITPLIYSRDPNVDQELLRILTMGKDTMRLLKKTTLPPIDGAIPRVSIGMAVVGEKENVVNMVLLSKRYVKKNRVFNNLTLAFTIIGAIAAALALVFGAPAVPTAILAVWQIIGCVILSVVSKKSFSVPKKKKDNKNVSE